MKILIPTLINGPAYASAALLRAAGHQIYITYDRSICQGVLSDSRFFSGAFEIAAPRGTLSSGYADRPNSAEETAYPKAVFAICVREDIELVWPFDDVQIVLPPAQAALRETGTFFATLAWAEAPAPAALSGLAA